MSPPLRSSQSLQPPNEYWRLWSLCCSVNTFQSRADSLRTQKPGTAMWVSLSGNEGRLKRKSPAFSLLPLAPLSLSIDSQSCLFKIKKRWNNQCYQKNLGRCSWLRPRPMLRLWAPNDQQEKHFYAWFRSSRRDN